MDLSDRKSPWWQYNLDGPITSTVLCCALLVVILGAVGFFVGGASLALYLIPLGVLAGATLALRLSDHPTMCKMRSISNRVMGRLGKIVFFYGSPIWIYVAIKYGIGLAIIVLGGISAAIMFGVGGTLALLVVFAHVTGSVLRLYSSWGR